MALGPLLNDRESPYGRTVNDILILPTGPLAEESLALAQSSESQPIVDHSIRSFLLARLLADHEGCLNDVAYDEDLLFAATVMHDLGLGEYWLGSGSLRGGGRRSRCRCAEEQGVAEADVDKVWEAIALHACIGIADRRGLLTYLTHRGVFMDIGRTEDPVASQLRQEVFNAYPRPAGDRSIADAIVKHAARSEAAAPRGSLAAELLREHREAGGTGGGRV